MEAGDQRLSIGAFARRARLSTRALRLYDRLGLLHPAEVDARNGYRWYRASQVETARLVAMLRQLDMPLERIAEVIAAPGPRGAELLASYWDDVERRIAAQRELTTHLRTRLAGGATNGETLPVRERHVPEQVVLTEQRDLALGELIDPMLYEDAYGWVGATLGRLIVRAREYGEVAGPTLVIYHEGANEDSDGPVEVCVPIEPATAVPAGVAIRREPAHREAYARIRKARLAYPQVFSVFDTVAQWIDANGRTVAGAPREVYFTDVLAAAPTDEVCDVAFPVTELHSGQPCSPLAARDLWEPGG